MFDLEKVQEILSEMPDEMRDQEGAGLRYRLRREFEITVPQLPNRALEAEELYECLGRLCEDPERVTVWVPSVDGLRHQGLLNHFEQAEGDILQFYFEYEARSLVEKFSLIPMGDGSFEWHYTDSENIPYVDSETFPELTFGPSKSTIDRRVRSKAGGKTLAALREDAECA